MCAVTAQAARENATRVLRAFALQRIADQRHGSLPVPLRERNEWVQRQQAAIPIPPDEQRIQRGARLERSIREWSDPAVAM